MAGFQKKERAVRGGGPPAGLCLEQTLGLKVFLHVC